MPPAIVSPMQSRSNSSGRFITLATAVSPPVRPPLIDPALGHCAHGQSAFSIMPRAMELFHLVSNVAESAGVMKEARLAATED